jgi:menaquinone-dependent protoporphyrinogen IX oxidase
LRKIFKLIFTIFAALIIILVAFGSIILLDIFAYTATGAQTLTPTGSSVGKAIVIYDPGMSGRAKGVADKVAGDLQEKGYTVTLAGVKSSTAGNTTGYNIIVVGGPVYAGALTSSTKDVLAKLVFDQGAKIGVYGSGQGATSPQDIAQIKQSIPTRSEQNLQNAIVVKIGNGEDLNARAQNFVNQLIT